MTDKIIGWIFMPSHIQHLMSNSNSKNNNSQGFEKFTNGFEGMCMSGGKVS